jgi:multiple antibiotic resistance protein
MEHWTEYSRFFVSLLVIFDPFAAIPVFLSLTLGYTQEERRRVARIATYAVLIVLGVAALSGETLLGWMGFSLGSFRVGGGIVLLLMALAMLRDERPPAPTAADEGQAASRASVAVVPLAIPLLAGPGAISAVIIGMQRSAAPLHPYLILGCILLASGLLYLMLRLAEPIGRLLGQVGLSILHRVFGLLLAAIAVEIMANGLKQLFPALGG